MSPRPLWRRWLFCAALWLWFRFGWEWSREVMGWSVLPTWLASGEELAAMARGEVGDAF